MTLIEVLVVVGIILLIFPSIINFFVDSFSFNRFISDGLSAQGEARRAFKTMVAEIRTASPSSLGAYPLSEATSTSFTFYSNIDTDAYKERVRYYLQGTTLMRGVIKPSGSPLTYNPGSETVTELVHGVATTSVFSYYDENYTGTTSPLALPVDLLSVRLVKILFTVDTSSTTAPGPLIFTTQVSMRNLKDNL